MIDFVIEEFEFYCFLYIVKIGFNYYILYIKYLFRL